MNGREIFSEKSGQGVQLQSHGALLASNIVLVQQTLQTSLVHCLNGQLVGLGSGSLIASSDSSFELLDGGLHSGLIGLVLLVSNLGTDDILLRGLDIGHDSHLLSCLYSYDNAL